MTGEQREAIRRARDEGARSSLAGELPKDPKRKTPLPGEHYIVASGNFFKPGYAQHGGLGSTLGHDWV